MKRIATPLTSGLIEERLDEILDAVLSSRRTATEPAHALAKRSRPEQDFIFYWLGVIIRTNSEMGFQFVSHASRAFELMDFEGVEAWIIDAMDIYDRRGLYPGSEAFSNAQPFAAEYALRPRRVELEQINGILNSYVCGLSGRNLHLQEGDDTFTDTETLFLPPEVTQYSGSQQNFLLYKATATHLWAQTRYGTFKRNAPGDALLSEKLNRFSDPEQARALFSRLEAHRIDACVRRDFPGMARDLQALTLDTNTADSNLDLQQAMVALESSGTTVEDTLRWVAQCLRRNVVVPDPLPWQGVLKLEQAEAVLAMRIEHEREMLSARLSEMLDEQTDESDEEDKRRFQLHDPQNQDSDEAVMLDLDGEAIKSTPEVAQLLTSILQDFQHIPPEYLAAAGASRADASQFVSPPDNDSISTRSSDTTDASNVMHYPEWDFRRRHYRKNWCALREIEMHPSSEPFVEQTLARYRGLVVALRRTFEALRDGNKRLRHQISGDNIDLDALITAHADAAAGHEMSDQLFTQHRRIDRDIAVMFMVDVSGSTKGWVNEAERESLVLLCEALEILGDRYAIYGFSGMTRKRCELYRIKRFDDDYGADVRARISGIKPQDYTRMGVIIRHLTRLLNTVEARTRLLITLSDGKPDDYDGYRGEYGIEDTRQALLEAKHTGVHPFCITIDHRGHDYLPHMYGAVNYTVIEDVRQLPVRVSDIYRRLTA